MYQSRWACFMVATAISTSSVAMNLGMGPYLGIQLGETSNHYSLTQLGLTAATVHYQGFSGRAFVGYQFNPYLGLEAGFLRASPARVKSINGTTQAGKINDTDIDVLLAGGFNLVHGFYLNGKFGAGYHQAKPTQQIRLASHSDYAHATVAHYRPVIGAGVGYALTPRLGLEASYTQVFHHRVMAKVTLWALGLTYHFCDFYDTACQCTAA